MRRIKFKAKAFTIIETLEIEIFFIVILLVVGSYYFAANEGITYFDSVYFGVITLAGVGYGDIVPHTINGKIISMIYAILGTPLFIVAAGLIMQYILGKKDEE